MIFGRWIVYRYDFRAARSVRIARCYRERAARRLHAALAAVEPPGATYLVVDTRSLQ